MTYHSVFLIKSPLQYLNALEALSAFELNPEQAMLLLMADRKSMPQLQALIRPEQRWGCVVHLADAPLRWSDESLRHVETGRSSYFGNPLFAIRKLRNLSRVLTGLKYVVIGDMGNPLMRHFANSARNAVVIVLDDGTATLKYSRERANKATPGALTPTRKKLQLTLKRRLLGLRDDRLPEIVFFSVYEIETRKPDRFVKNLFERLRNTTPTLGATESIYFLGGPLVESGELTEAEYQAQLLTAKTALGDAVTYVAHRREARDKVQRLCANLGWQSCLFDYPIEYQLAVVGPRPQILASFISSALLNCRLIFGDTLDIRSFKLHPDHFAHHSSEKGRRIEAIYDEYQASDISVVDMLTLPVSKS